LQWKCIVSGPVLHPRDARASTTGLTADPFLRRLIGAKRTWFERQQFDALTAFATWSADYPAAGIAPDKIAQYQTE